MVETAEISKTEFATACLLGKPTQEGEMPSGNPKSKRKLIIEGPEPGQGQRKRKLTLEGAKSAQGRRAGKGSGDNRQLTSNERISRLEGRIGDLEAALRALLDSRGTSSQQVPRYSPVRIQGEPLSSTILRDRGSY
jgi:hypothetical protein